ncbi:MAG: hypothetical protein V4543_02570, partial [Bacteroidota bacterium]
SAAVVLRATATQAQPLSVGLGITYQWQKLTSTSPDVWTDVTTGSGAQTVTYTTATSNQAGSYRLKVTCSAGGVGYSGTVNVVSSTIITPANLPFTESFENAWTGICAVRESPGMAWRQTAPNFSSDADASWRRDDDGASAGWNNPVDGGPYSPSASAGSHSARFHTTWASTPYTASLDLYLNFTGANVRTLSFDWINASGTDHLDVTVSTDGGATFANPASGAVRLNTSATWANKTVVLSGYNAASFLIRFKATTDFGDNDIGLDNISVTESPACASLPSAGTVADAALCSGSTVTLTAVGATSSTGLSGISYKWQSAPTIDGTYTDITGATTTTYTTPAITATSFFKFVTICANSGSTSTSPVTVTVNPYYLCYCGPGATPPNAADL